MITTEYLLKCKVSLIILSPNILKKTVISQYNIYHDQSTGKIYITL
jgi:hypothetical protein